MNSLLLLDEATVSRRPWLSFAVFNPMKTIRFNQFEIVHAVVRRVSVFMVNYFTAAKASTDNSLHDDAMNISIVGLTNIPIGAMLQAVLEVMVVRAAMVFPVALLVAENTRPEIASGLMCPSTERLDALRAYLVVEINSWWHRVSITGVMGQ